MLGFESRDSPNCRNSRKQQKRIGAVEQSDRGREQSECAIASPAMADRSARAVQLDAADSLGVLAATPDRLLTLSQNLRHDGGSLPRGPPGAPPAWPESDRALQSVRSISSAPSRAFRSAPRQMPFQGCA